MKKVNLLVLACLSGSLFASDVQVPQEQDVELQTSRKNKKQPAKTKTELAKRIAGHVAKGAVAYGALNVARPLIYQKFPIVPNTIKKGLNKPLELMGSGFMGSGRYFFNPPNTLENMYIANAWNMLGATPCVAGILAAFYYGLYKPYQEVKAYNKGAYEESAEKAPQTRYDLAKQLVKNGLKGAAAFWITGQVNPMADKVRIDLSRRGLLPPLQELLANNKLQIYICGAATLAGIYYALYRPYKDAKAYKNRDVEETLDEQDAQADKAVESVQ